MEQATFAELEHDSKRRRTRREIFLEKMDRLVPWKRLEKRVEAFYPKAGRGRRPYPLRTMLRVHCVQLFHDLSDPGMEDLLYDVESVRRFAGLRLTGPLPDEASLRRRDDPEVPAPAGGARARRRPVRGDQRASGVAGAARAQGDDRGREHHRGAEFDEEREAGAGSGDAPDEEGQPVALRDEGAHRGGRGDGPGAQPGDDAANGSDVATAHAVLHGGEGEVRGDAGYQGVGKRDENKHAAVDWRTAMKPGKRRLLDKSGPEEAAEKHKASIRAKVEHPFLYVKGA